MPIMAPTIPTSRKATVMPRARKKAAGIPTQAIYCGDNLDKLRKLPDGCVDLIYIDPPFNSNRNYEVFWGETKEKRAFEDPHESTRAYIEFMRPRIVLLPLRLARQPLRQGYARPDFRGGLLPEGFARKPSLSGRFLGR
jgi:hypothetical protein